MPKLKQLSLALRPKPAPKKRQHDTGDPYRRFDIPDQNYPRNQFAPTHPDFAVKAEVATGTGSKTLTFVDMAIGECECKDGAAFRFDKRKDKWYPAPYCPHKMRVLSSVMTPHIRENNAELNAAYIKGLATRYNSFEVVSAFHKELRRGDFEKAWFWALLLASFRHRRGVFRYMLNIIYEETRDHDLGAFLLKCATVQSQQTIENLARAVSWFCVSTKKWEMVHRYAIFEAEMQGYDRLVKKYGKEVAGHGNYVPTKDKLKLLGYMQKGVELQDLVLFQEGLKGLQKLKYSDRKSDENALHDHRYWLYERLYDIAEKHCGDNHSVWGVFNYVNQRVEADLSIGYHELNAIGDALMGESYSAGLLSPAQRKAHAARPLPPLPIGKWPTTPLYAADNHTYKGKALMRRFADQLDPGAKQTDIDFRWCGAYFGVAYRMVSFKQHGKVEEWHKVKWPKPLYRIVNSLWY
jgi:hypothetical protein